MKKIMFSFFVTSCFIFTPVAFAQQEYETYVLLKETSKTAFGPCVEFYDKNYTTPYKTKAPSVGYGLVAGNLGPDGWQITLTMTKTPSSLITGKMLESVYGNAFDYSIERLKMQYSINTIKYEKYFNVVYKRTETASISRINYLDIGFGVGLMEVRGVWETTYARSSLVRVVAKETVGSTGPFSTISARLGVKTEHIGFGAVVSQALGGTVSGFFPGMTCQGNVNVRW